MKNLFITLVFAAAAILGASEKAHAQASGTAVYIPFSSNNVSTGAWQPIISQTTRAIKAISVQNGGERVLKLGIAGAGSATTAESTILYIPASQSVPVVLPVGISGGYRISLEAVGTYQSTGVGLFNFFY